MYYPEALSSGYLNWVSQYCYNNGRSHSLNMGHPGMLQKSEPLDFKAKVMIMIKISLTQMAIAPRPSIYKKREAPL